MPQSSQRPSAPPSVSDSALGLSAEDVQALRQQQSTAHFQARSTAGQQASRHGRLLIDPASLRLLQRHMDGILSVIAQRLQQLNRQLDLSTREQYDRAGNAIQRADAEIRRLHETIQMLDDLELEFAKMRRIREIVRGYRARVEDMERRLGR